MASGWTSPPEDIASRFTSLTARSDENTGNHRLTSTTSPVTSGRRPETFTPHNNMTSHYDDVFLLPYGCSDDGVLNRGDYMSDRKYVTSLYHSSENVTLSPTVSCHNNNNNNENNFRSYTFALPTSHSMTLKHYDSPEFQSFGYHPSQRPSFETSVSFRRADQRSAAEQADQLHIAAMQYDGAVVPAGTGYNGNAASSSSCTPSPQLDDGGCCRPGPVGGDQVQLYLK